MFPFSKITNLCTSSRVWILIWNGSSMIPWETIGCRIYALSGIREHWKSYKKAHSPQVSSLTFQETFGHNFRLSVWNVYCSSDSWFLQPSAPLPATCSTAQKQQLWQFTLVYFVGSANLTPDRSGEPSGCIRCFVKAKSYLNIVKKIKTG